MCVSEEWNEHPRVHAVCIWWFAWPLPTLGFGLLTHGPDEWCSMPFLSWGDDPTPSAHGFVGIDRTFGLLHAVSPRGVPLLSHGLRVWSDSDRAAHFSVLAGCVLSVVGITCTYGLSPIARCRA